MGCEATPDGGPAARIAAFVPRQRLQSRCIALVTDRQNTRLVRGHEQVEITFFDFLGLSLFE